MTDRQHPSQGTAQQQAVQGNQQVQGSFLGFSVDQLAGLSVDELTGNKTAITMMMHYYKQLTEENTALKNERNTLSTYVNGYNQKKSDTRIGASLMALSNVFLGFAVNLLTAESGSGNRSMPGIALFACGILMLFVGLYFSLKDAD